jgi:hypothetical protein
MSTPRRVAVLRGLAVVAAAAAAVVALLTVKVTVSSSTQTEHWRETVLRLAHQAKDPKVCFNVRYTAALYAVNHRGITLDTWTMAAADTRTTIREWMLLKGRKQMAERVLIKMGASPEAIACYAAHRSLAQLMAA